MNYLEPCMFRRVSFWLCSISLIIFVVFEAIGNDLTNNMCDHRNHTARMSVLWIKVVHAGMVGAYVSAILVQILIIGQVKSERFNHFFPLTINAVGMCSLFTLLLSSEGHVRICIDTFSKVSFFAEWPARFVILPAIAFAAITFENKMRLSTYDWCMFASTVLRSVLNLLLNLRPNFLAGVLMKILASIPILLFTFKYIRLQKSNNVVDASSSSDPAKQITDLSTRLTKLNLYYIVCVFLVVDLIGFIVVTQVHDDATTHIVPLLIDTIANLSVTASAIIVSLKVMVFAQSAVIAECEHNEAKRNYLRYVFHDVRVPLNSISMGLNLLEGVDGLSHTDLDIVKMMYEACEFMGATLNDVLSMEKIEAGALTLDYTSFSLRAMIQHVVMSVNGQSSAKKLTLATRMLRDVPDLVIGDKFRIEHVLANLLSNAIKFSPTSGNITIEVTAGALREEVSDENEALRQPEHTTNRRKKSIMGRLIQASAHDGSFRFWGPVGDFSHGDSVSQREVSTPAAKLASLPDATLRFVCPITIAVIDEGRGISKEDAKSLFALFKQVGPNGAQAGQGTGIGLALCKQVVELHGGTIQCESAVGEGSTFFFTIPFALTKLPSKGNSKPSSNQSSKHSGKPSSRNSNPPSVSVAVRGNSFSLPLVGSLSAVYQKGLGGSYASLGDITEDKDEKEDSIQFPKLQNTGLPLEDEASMDSSSQKVDECDALSNDFTARDSIVQKSQFDSFVMLLALVVDDSISNRKILSMLLTKRGALCEEAENGLDAVEKVEVDVWKYGVIFMDRHMPIMTGIEATAIVRSKGYKNFIVGLTGASFDDEINEFLDSGADLVLTKPYTVQHMQALVTHFSTHRFTSHPGLKWRHEYGKLVELGNSDDALPNTDA